MGDRRRWKTIVRRAGLAVAGALVVVLAGGLAWFAVAGRDFVWSKVQPGHAALLAGREIPDELPAEAWREDLDFLARELPRRFVRFDHAVDRESFESEVAALRSRLDGLSRERTVLGLMGVATLPGTGTGHTGIPPFQRALDWRFYPFYAWLFDDGVWITLAGAGAEEALGAEVLAVGGRPVDEVLAAAAPYLPADNEMGRKGLQGAVLSFAEMLQALGVVGEDGVAELSLRRAGGEPFTLHVEPVRLASLGGLRWGGALQRPVEGVWSPADPRPRARRYAFAYDEAERLLYVQLNEVRDQGDGDTLAAFAERLGAFVDGHAVDRFVIDLRANGGGNNQLLEPLLELVSGHPVIDRRGVLYTLIGRRTYSAAGNLASALERRTKTLFAGEPTGAAPNHYGDAVDLPLPRSGVIVRISTRYWEDGGPGAGRPWIAPSEPALAVPLTHDDHFDGDDPVLAAVLAHEPGPPPGEVATAAGPPALLAELPGRYQLDPFRILSVEAAAGRLRMEILDIGTFASSDLYLLAGDGAAGAPVRLATDLPGVVLEATPVPGRPPALSVDWRGVSLHLPRLPADFRLPIDRVRDGSPGDGIATFRRLAAAGEVPDSRTELELNRIGYDLLEAGRIEDAVEVFRLQTELYPEVANGFDSLGDGYRRAGDPERAAAAYRESLARDPGFRHSRRMLDELEDGG